MQANLCTERELILFLKASYTSSLRPHTLVQADLCTERELILFLQSLEDLLGLAAPLASVFVLLY